MDTLPEIFPTEDGNFVKFEWGTAQNAALSREKGRPVFDKVLMATIFSPGQGKSEAVHELERYIGEEETPSKRRDDVIQRVQKPYQAFKENAESEAIQGTALDAWPALDVRQVAALKALNIHTVEALAALSDTGLQNVGMGARDLQVRAQAFLDAAEGSADVQNLASENAELLSKVDGLQGQIDDLCKRLEDATAPKEDAEPPKKTTRAKK